MTVPLIDSLSPKLASFRASTAVVAATALLVGASATGCESDPGPGSVLVPVELGNSKTCAEVNISTLEATLGDSTVTVPCVDTSLEVRFDDVAKGTYDLSVVGRNDEGVGTIDSGGTPDLWVEVLGEGATVGPNLSPVRLTDAPAHLFVRRDLGFLTCESANMTSFRVIAFEEGGSTILLKDTFDCASPTTDAEGYYAVPDPSRVVKGKLLGEMAIQPLDAADMAVGAAVIFEFAPPGPGRDVKFTLSACSQTGCTGTGEPD
ncbi:MAG: hypothetical protein V3V08_03535 [Nannocystaceae bacterium]